jgi:hypothetical protein
MDKEINNTEEIDNKNRDEIVKKVKRHVNLQSIKMNNFITYNNNIDPNYILNNMIASDEDLIKNMNNKVMSLYSAKINLINYVLNNKETIINNNITDIKKFFKFINPLNNEYSLDSYEWDFKLVDNLLFVQNSIPKILADKTCIFYLNYITKIKNILNNSDLEYKYHEYKTARFYKNLDIIFSFRI